MRLCEENTLSKKLKRRIQELCGFNNIEDREKRLSRANEILNSSDLKQAICNQILGCTFKDVERAMEAIVNERQLTPAQEEELELKQTAPQKFDPDLQFKLNKSAASPKREPSRYRTLTREEVAELLAASNEPIKSTPPLQPIDYLTYSREEVQELMRQHYEYLAEEKRRKEERKQWDSTKTIESAPKTASTKKRSTRTKA
jgi:hypothetical protein